MYDLSPVLTPISVKSFVGGLFRDQGVSAVEEWLFKLFPPYVELAYGTVRVQHGLTSHPPPSPPLPVTPPSTSPLPRRMPLSRTDMNTDTIAFTGHLGLFNQRLQQINRQVEWVYSATDPDTNESTVIDPDVLRGTKTTPVWYVSVFVSGEYFGRGKGITKKVARNEAAKEGLKKLENQHGRK